MCAIPLLTKAWCALVSKGKCVWNVWIRNSASIEVYVSGKSTWKIWQISLIFELDMNIEWDGNTNRFWRTVANWEECSTFQLLIPLLILLQCLKTKEYWWDRAYETCTPGLKSQFMPRHTWLAFFNSHLVFHHTERNNWAQWYWEEGHSTNNACATVQGNMQGIAVHMNQREPTGMGIQNCAVQYFTGLSAMILDAHLHPISCDHFVGCYVSSSRSSVRQCMCIPPVTASRHPASASVTQHFHACASPHPRHGTAWQKSLLLSVRVKEEDGNCRLCALRFYGHDSSLLGHSCIWEGLDISLSGAFSSLSSFCSADTWLRNCTSALALAFK